MKTPLTSSATMTEASERAAAVEFTAGWFGSPRGRAPLGGGNAGAFSMGSSAGSGGKSARLRKGHHE